jgi:hydrogenase expression/formation protein HypE
VHENRIPVTEPVRGACEILGLDPLYVANEGRFLAALPRAQGEQARGLMGEDAVIIGEVVEDHPATVVLRSGIGGNRVLDMLSGEQLPRIC